MLPAECYAAIATYLIPPDAYSLCVTSQFFHTIDQAVKSKPGQKCKTFAKDIMNAALLASLDRALLRNNVGFTTKDLRRLPRMLRQQGLSPGDVVLAGGLMLEACAGGPMELSTSDADLFSSGTDLAPIVARSWLVTVGKQSFCGIKSRYYMDTFDEYARGSQTKRIDQVEAYGPVSHIQPHDLLLFCSNDTDLLNQALQAQPNPPVRSLLPLKGNSFLYFRPCKCKHRLCIGPLHDSCHPLVTTDLIIASPGRTATDTVNDFDLDICQNTFDGKTFRLKDPSVLFNPNRKHDKTRAFSPIATIVHNENDLVAFFAPPFEAETTAERLQHLEELLPDEGNMFLRFIWSNGCHFGFRTEHARSTRMVDLAKLRRLVFEVHLFIFKSVARINKYKGRGICVTNTEHFPSKYSIPCTHTHEHMPIHEVTLMRIQLYNGAKAGWTQDDFTTAAMKYTETKQILRNNYT